MASRSAGDELWARVYRWRIAGTIHTGITRVGYFLLLVVPSGSFDFQIRPDDRPRILLTTFVYSALGGVVGRRHGRRVFEPVARWLDANREATVEEQECLLAQPQRQAAATLVYWVVGGLVGSVTYFIWFEPNLAASVTVLLGLSFLGCHAAAFVYLLVERVLRTTAAQSMLSSQPVRLTILSVKNRFLLAFVFGPGITTVGIAIFLSARASNAYDVAPAIWPVVVLGLIDGYVLVALAAASVTRPMEEIRSAMKRVLEGDLHADVAVDSGNEVGLLQTGFNSMLVGLRERELLRQLLGQSAGTEVADRLVALGTDFEGVEVEASVLMIDLIGSTPLAEATSGKEVLLTLNCLFDAVIRTTTDHGGWVNRFVGDAAVCVFGAPVEHADHATRALSAARAMHAELEALRSDRPWLDAAIGVSSGRLMAANVGSAARFEFTVVGDAANEAARLTELAKQRPGRVIASGAAVEGSDPEERSWWAGAGEVRLRGKSFPTAIHEPLGSLSAEVEDLMSDGRLGSP